MPSCDCKATRWLLIYFLCCGAALIWPGYPWAAAQAPTLVCGVPFALFWNVLWVVLTFIAVLLYHLWTGEGERG
jgi:hypothetical protein